jgi:hypothetical protein
MSVCHLCNHVPCVCRPPRARGRMDHRQNPAVVEARANAEREVRVVSLDIDFGTTEQPAPIPNAAPAVWDLVVADMRARDAAGLAKYGTRLQPHNGRDALLDAYQEALDLAVYLRTAIYERDGR